MKTLSLKHVGAALLFALCTFGTTAQAATSPLWRPEVFAKFSLGFAGGAAPGFAVGADTTIGKGKWAEHLRLGGAFAAHFTGLGTALDLDAVLRPQYAFKVGSGYLAVHANVPLGLNINTAGTGATFGVHWGLVPGVRYYFNNNWGVVTELGLDLHSVFGVGTAATGIWNIGATYAF